MSCLLYLACTSSVLLEDDMRGVHFGHCFPTEAFTKPKSLEDECRSSSAKGSNSSAWMQGESFAAGHKKTKYQVCHMDMIPGFVTKCYRPIQALVRRAMFSVHPLNWFEESCLQNHDTNQ